MKKNEYVADSRKMISPDPSYRFGLAALSPMPYFLTWQSLLLFLAACQFAARWLLLPLVRDSLAFPQYYDNIFLAAFTMTASFAPDMASLKERAMEGKDLDEVKKND